MGYSLISQVIVNRHKHKPSIEKKYKVSKTHSSHQFILLGRILSDLILQN